MSLRDRGESARRFRLLMLPLAKAGRAMSPISEDAPRLYLITPLIADGSAFVAAFETALGAGDIACVFLQVKAADPDGAQTIVRRLAPIAQRRGIACLVSDPQLAADTDADGVHIDGVGARLEAALAAMQPGRIVGAGGLKTRDEAMQAGEAGVDYLMFGGPAEQQAFANVRERVAWWAEIFNLPCGLCATASRCRGIGSRRRRFRGALRGRVGGPARRCRSSRSRGADARGSA